MVTARIIKISIQNLTVQFGNVTALKNLSLDIFSNEIFTIIGPANSGKSSLLQSLNRLNDLTATYRKSGKIMIDGKNSGNAEALLLSAGKVHCRSMKPIFYFVP